MVDAVVVVASEGGESTFQVRGHFLDGATFRAFAKTRLQLSHQRLAKEGVKKLGATTSDKHRPSIAAAAGDDDAAASDLGSVLSQLAGTPATEAAADESALLACPEADAVERLLSAEVSTPPPYVAACVWVVRATRAFYVLLIRDTAKFIPACRRRMQPRMCSRPPRRRRKSWRRFPCSAGATSTGSRRP
jgi:hypothetical protein